MSDITDLLEPDDRAALADGPLYKNVGQWLDHTDHEPPACGDPGCKALAPPEWAKLAEPCETCAGAGVVDIARKGIWNKCPDCHEGKPVHTITVACGHGGVLKPGGYEDRNGIGHPCRCDGSGTVSVRVTVELVPVVKFEFGNEALTCGVRQIVLDGTDSPKLWSGDGEITPIVVHGPSVSPGDWVAVITKVET